MAMAVMCVWAAHCSPTPIEVEVVSKSSVCPETAMEVISHFLVHPDTIKKVVYKFWVCPDMTKKVIPEVLV